MLTVAIQADIFRISRIFLLTLAHFQKWLILTIFFGGGDFSTLTIHKLSRSHMSCRQKCGPPWYTCFVIFWTQTNNQSISIQDLPPKYRNRILRNIAQNTPKYRTEYSKISHRTLQNIAQNTPKYRTEYSKISHRILKKLYIFCK